MKEELRTIKLLPHMFYQYSIPSCRKKTKTTTRRVKTLRRNYGSSHLLLSHFTRPVRRTASVSGRSSTHRLLPGSRGKSLIGRASSSTTTKYPRFATSGHGNVSLSASSPIFVLVLRVLFDDRLAFSPEESASSVEQCETHAQFCALATWERLDQSSGRVIPKFRPRTPRNLRLACVFPPGRVRAC